MLPWLLRSASLGPHPARFHLLWRWRGQVWIIWQLADCGAAVQVQSPHPIVLSLSSWLVPGRITWQLAGCGAAVPVLSPRPTALSLSSCLVPGSVADPDSNPDPDPPDPHVFVPPGSGSGSTSRRYGSGSCSGSGSGSFYHHAKIVRKTLILTILLLFLTFYLWKIM